MNVLSIGNSFSTDAHTYLSAMAKAAGKELLLCNLHIGGCSLEKHWNNWKEENEDYYYEVYLPFETEMSRPDGVALHEAVEDEEWDVITLQQCSPLSGIKESYSPYLSELAEYCRLMQPKAKLMFHQTWAYENGFESTAFRNYDYSQEKMYSALTKACVEASVEADIDTVIPSGRAWQTARQTVIGDNLTRDGMHGNSLGCFLAGACFYEMIFGEDIRENPYCPADISPEICELLKICAHIAVEEGIIK